MTDKAGSGDTSSIHDRPKERRLDQLYDFHLRNCYRLDCYYCDLDCYLLDCYAKKNYLFKPLIVVIVSIFDKC